MNEKASELHCKVVKEAREAVKSMKSTVRRELEDGIKGGGQGDGGQ
jgi:hypothetical protein